MMVPGPRCRAGDGMPYEIDCHISNSVYAARTRRSPLREDLSTQPATASPNSLLQGISQGIFENVRQETGKANDYRAYFNPKFKEQGILRELWRRHRRRVRVVLRTVLVHRKSMLG